MTDEPTRSIHCDGCRPLLPTGVGDDTCHGIREHSDEWCMAIERERLAQIAELEEHLQGCRTALGDCIAESDAEITRLRAVIAQLREDWRPKAQQEIAAMTAAREVARLWVRVERDMLWVEVHHALDNLVEALDRG
jgi:cob(I)alamin adenosyltransferase